MSRLSRSADDRQAGLSLVFLQRLIVDARSSAELQGAITMLQAMGYTSAVQAGLVSTLVQTLSAGRFIDAAGFTGLQNIVAQGMKLALRTPGAGDTLVPALRDYVVRQATAPRCSGKNAWPSDGQLAQLNRTLCQRQQTTGDCPFIVTARQVAMTTVDSGHSLASIGAFYDSENGKTAAAAFRRINFDPGTQQRLKVGSRDAEWLQACEDLLWTLRQWKPTPDDRTLVAMAKAYPLQRLIELLPPVHTRGEALELFLEALADLDVDGTRPPVWFAFARPLLALATKLEGPESRRINMFVESDPVLRLYAALKN